MASSLRKMYRSFTIVFDSNTLRGKLTAAVTVIMYISFTARSISASVSFCPNARRGFAAMVKPTISTTIPIIEYMIRNIPFSLAILYLSPASLYLV